MSDSIKKQPHRFPPEFPDIPEKYSQEIVAIERIEEVTGNETPQNIAESLHSDPRSDTGIK